MITIIDAAKAAPTTIRTNDIPRNTTFKGTITSARTGRRYPNGLWLNLGDGYATLEGPVVISLSKVNGSYVSDHALISLCSAVEDYEPVDIEIHVKKGK